MQRRVTENFTRRGESFGGETACFRMRTKWNTRWRARLPAKPRHAFNKFVYPAQPGSNRPGLGSSATSYLSTMARSIKRETFPFKRSFSIIKCFPSPPKSTSRKLHASILSSSFFFVFQLVEPGRRENLLPYPTVTPFFSPLCATSAFLMPPTYHQRTVAQRSHRNLFASGYTTPHRGQQSSGPSWKIDQKRSDRARALFSSRSNISAAPPLGSLCSIHKACFNPLFSRHVSFPPVPFISRRCLSLVTENVANEFKRNSRRGPQTTSLPPEILDDIGHRESSWWIKESSMAWKRNPLRPLSCPVYFVRLVGSRG